MATDAIGFGMALAAIHLADRGSQRAGRSFGLYRLEILAALANAALLVGVAAYVLYEAVGRLGGHAAPDAGPVLVAAGIGLAANVAAFLLLRKGAGESLNVEGAYLEVRADLVGSVGVILGAVLFATTGWSWVDPVVGAALGLWIVPRAWRLARQRCDRRARVNPPPRARVRGGRVADGVLTSVAVRSGRTSDPTWW